MAEDQKREQILQAALDIMQTYGVKKFTQPQVAKAAGIRQSLLTYYFPKKIDLIKGLLQGHSRTADDATRKNSDTQRATALREGLAVLTSDRGRMRFFLSLILEAQLEPELQTLVDAHMSSFDAKVAQYYGRSPGDADVTLFLATLRGIGMRHLVSGAEPSFDIDMIAQKFGLNNET